MLFSLGQTVITKAASAFLEKLQCNPLLLLGRHSGGDFGDIDEQDAKSNTRALIHDERIVSVYKLATGKVYIITEWDRSCTTIMMAEDY